jgi:hypothetical protein
LIEMRFLRHRPHPENGSPAAGSPAVIGAEADVRRAIREGAERRRPRAEGFSVLCAVPQVFREPVTAAEADVATSRIARELRAADQFCLLDDASYVVLLADTDEGNALVVAQRLAVDLTLHMAALLGRKWHVGVARCPHDARTEAALIEFARVSALDTAA